MESVDINQSILDTNMNGFDIIYWINLDRSKDRYSKMMKILDKVSIKNIRINAIDGKLESDNIIYDKINNAIQQYRTKIEYACLLSHLEAIKSFSESEYNTALILEDDTSLDFVKYWDKSIEDIINNAPKNWDIIMLNYNSDNSVKLTDLYTLNNGDIWCAGAYIINKSSAIKFIRTIYKNDKYILDISKKHTADNYLFTSLITYTYKYPYFTYPDDNNSTIHSQNLQGHMASKKRIIDAWEKYYIEKNKTIINKYVNGFDIIYWINLDRSKDRFNSMTNILSTFPVKNIRVPAIDGKKSTDDAIYSNYNLINNITQPHRTKIEYACLLSHLTAIKQFSESNYEIALIMEDDISMDFIKYWNKSIEDVIKNAPKNWDIIMLSYIINKNIPDLTETYTLNKNGHIWSALSYLINKKTAVEFINSIYKNNKYNLNPLKKHTADDYLFSNLITYVYKYPFFIYPNDNDSTIHADHLNTHMISKNRIQNILANTNNPNKDIIDKYMNGIDIIYWINLERSVDRHKNMIKILDMIPIKNIRIKAIDGKNENINNIHNKFITSTFDRSNTEYACLLSHLITIKQFSESKYDTCLIFEDDISIEFIKYWNKSIKDILAAAPKDWEVLMLTYITDKPLEKEYTYNTGNIYSTAAYIINKKAAIKFINDIYSNGKFILSSDKIHTADEFIFKSFITYAYKYAYFIYGDNNDSTIHMNHYDFHKYSKDLIVRMWKRFYNIKIDIIETINSEEKPVHNNNILKIIIFILIISIIFILFFMKR